MPKKPNPDDQPKLDPKELVRELSKDHELTHEERVEKGRSESEADQKKAMDEIWKQATEG